MFDVGTMELLVIALVALLVVGPKELPALLRQLGRWVGRARGIAGQFRVGIDAMIREAEIEDMKKQWAEHNARIMAEHPVTPDMHEATDTSAAQPAPPPTVPQP